MQPNTRQISENPVGEGEGEEGLWESERPRTPWVLGKTQSQLSWAHGGSQRLSHQPENLHGTDLGPLLMCYSWVIGLLVELPAEGVGAISGPVACSRNPSLLRGCLV